MLCRHALEIERWLHPSIVLVSLALQEDSLPLSHQGSPLITMYICYDSSKPQTLTSIPSDAAALESPPYTALGTPPSLLWAVGSTTAVPMALTDSVLVSFHLHQGSKCCIRALT